MSLGRSSGLAKRRSKFMNSRAFTFLSSDVEMAGNSRAVFSDSVTVHDVSEPLSELASFVAAMFFHVFLLPRRGLFREANRSSELLASYELESESEEERCEVSLGITRFLFVDFPFFFTK